jgi:hypothetical protein
MPNEKIVGSKLKLIGYWLLEESWRRSVVGCRQDTSSIIDDADDDGTMMR